VPREKVELPKRSKKEAYDDIASIENRHAPMHALRHNIFTHVFVRSHDKEWVKEVNHLASKHFDGAIKLSLLFGQIRRAHF
jgi:hypothetical protein